MIYKYKAFDGSETVIGNIEALNLKEAKDKIKKSGLRPIKIEENIESTNSLYIKTKFNYKDLYLLFRQLSLLVESGINIEDSFEILAFQFKKEKREIILKLKENLRSGLSLAESMKKTYAFPDLVISMVYVGENTSSLGEIFHNLSNYYFKRRNNRSKMINAISYPIILLITSVIVINFLIINVIPKFSEIFTYNQNILPLPTRIIIGISDFIHDKYTYLIIFILLFISLILYIYKKRPEKIHKILLKFKFYKLIETLNFTFNMNLLLSSGITINESIKTLIHMEKNIILKSKYKIILQKIKSGESFWKSTRDINIFPEMLISMIHVGEESSDLIEIFFVMSKFYEDEIENNNKKFLEIIGPILIIILSFIVGFIVLSIALPIFDMVNQF